MKIGIVKWFNDSKGYGFITQDDNTEVFVHYSNIKGKGHRSLEEGQKVEYEVCKGEKGLFATEVGKLD